jgi:hypothetical protein
MRLYAVVTDKETKKTFVMKPNEGYTTEYSTKKAFKRDLRANGYSIQNNFIYTEEEWNNPELFDEISNKLYNRKERKRNIRKCIRQARKKDK